MGYILITPIKNENKYLPTLKRIVLRQTIKPLLWVIVDSGSEDGSYELAKELFKDYPWIHIIKQRTFFEQGYSHKNFAQAINEGYAYAKEIASKEKLDYSFIGKTDATPILSENYFEVLLEEMKKDPRLAITCGSYILVHNGKRISLKPLSEISLTGFNDIRLYRKDFFEEVGGYPITPSPDAILLIKAIKRGWKVKIVDRTYFIKPRIGGSKIGMWKGAKLNGKTMYFLGYHPLLVIFNALYNSIKFPPHYQGLGMIFGYVNSYIHREKKIEDNEILEYFGKERLEEVISALRNKFLGG